MHAARQKRPRRTKEQMDELLAAVQGVLDNYDGDRISVRHLCYRLASVGVLAVLATKTGTNLLYLFEIPDPVKRTELWLYRPQRALRLVRTLPNPCQRPLSERIAGMPPANWDQD